MPYSRKLFEWAPKKMQKLQKTQTQKTKALLLTIEILREFCGEFFGSFLLILFGIGSVASAILTGAQVGLWQVAVVWGWGVTISIYCSAGLSGAHLNPAITLALALLRRKAFKWWKIFHYWVAQLLGGWLAGLVVFLVWGEAIKEYERENNIDRGSDGSYVSAAMFGEYFPNPGVDLDNDTVTPVAACAIEALGTGILAFVIFALTDPHNPGTKTEAFIAIRPLFIGFTVANLISLYAPLTQAGWNPARDFGPRLIPAMAGWGTQAIPGPRNGFWVFIIGPLIGAPLGAAIYQYGCSIHYRIKRWLEKYVLVEDKSSSDEGYDTSEEHSNEDDAVELPKLNYDDKEKRKNSNNDKKKKKKKASGKPLELKEVLGAISRGIKESDSEYSSDSSDSESESYKTSISTHEE